MVLSPRGRLCGCPRWRPEARLRGSSCGTAHVLTRGWKVGSHRWGEPVLPPQACECWERQWEGASAASVPARGRWLPHGSTFCFGLGPRVPESRPAGLILNSPTEPTESRRQSGAVPTLEDEIQGPSVWSQRWSLLSHLTDDRPLVCAVPWYCVQSSYVLFCGAVLSPM